MTRNILVVCMAIFWSCTSQTQSLNKQINNDGQQPFLLGKIDKNGLTSKNYNSWFSSQYQDYEINNEYVEKISEKLKDYTILVFMGTWCGDSRREVPRFYKILEAANFPEKQLTTVALSSASNLYKQSPQHEESGLNIHRVPIFIFYKNGKEVNRIVEHPVNSIVEDVFNITQDNYTSNYQLVTKVNSIIDDSNFYDKALEQIPNYKTLTKNIYELNTYARILVSTKRNDKALEVLKLNAELFSDNHKVHENLANLYLKSNQRNSALLSYEKALKMNPSNLKVKNKIQELKSELSGSNN